jgi:hypothetical protein
MTITVVALWSRWMTCVQKNKIWVIPYIHSINRLEPLTASQWGLRQRLHTKYLFCFPGDALKFRFLVFQNQEYHDCNTCSRSTSASKVEESSFWRQSWSALRWYHPRWLTESLCQASTLNSFSSCCRRWCRLSSVSKRCGYREGRGWRSANALRLCWKSLLRFVLSKTGGISIIRLVMDRKRRRWRTGSHFIRAPLKCRVHPA